MLHCRHPEAGAAGSHNGGDSGSANLDSWLVGYWLEHQRQASKLEASFVILQGIRLFVYKHGLYPEGGWTKTKTKGM